jgi:hypothetical protein
LSSSPSTITFTTLSESTTSERCVRPASVRRDTSFPPEDVTTQALAEFTTKRVKRTIALRMKNTTSTRPTTVK